MTSTASQVRRTPRWSFALPLVLLALAVVVAGVAALSLQRAASPDPQPIDPGDRVRISAAGLRLLQDDGSGATCRIERAGDTFELAGGEGTVTADGRRFTVVGVSPREAEAGLYAFACEGEPRGLYAARPGSLVQGLALAGGAFVLLVAAGASTGRLLARRRRAPAPTR